MVVPDNEKAVGRFKVAGSVDKVAPYRVLSEHVDLHKSIVPAPVVYASILALSEAVSQGPDTS